MVTKRGPKTDDGRAAVRLNAVRHGVLATTPVIPGLESAEDWEAHVAGISESLEPVGYLEAVLVARLAVTLWRLQRVVRFEQELIAVQQQEIAERVEEREAGLEGWRTLLQRPALGHADPAELPRLRTATRLLERLPNLADAAPLTGGEVGVLLLDMARRRDVNLDSLPVAGIPRDIAWEEYPGWTAGLLREALAAVARRARRRLETVLDEERDWLTERVAHAQETLARRELREQRIRGELLLPEAKGLEKLVRYEAHLNRQFYQALHELEALQTRRRGGQAPLARLDVHAIPDTAS
jgi:hypothetical protein